MYDRGLWILEQYGLTAKTSSRGRGVLLYETEEGWVSIREYGGTMITMGSDAHSVENVGNGIPQACALAQKAGFEKVTVFQNRKPQQFDIV